MSKVTIRDIAKECGTSYYTVSSVLHGRSDVGEKTRKRVWETIKRMNYNPLKNMPLAEKVKSKTMALILPDSSTTSSPFFQRAVMSATAAAATRQYGCEVFPEKPAMEAILADPLKIHAYHGVLLFCPNLDWDEQLDKIISHGLHAVTIRRGSSLEKVTSLSDSDGKGIVMAVDHLYELGHRRLGFLGIDITRGSSLVRKDTMVRHLGSRGVPTDDMFISNLHEKNLDRIAEALQERLSADTCPTALICDSDTLAAHTIRLLVRMGLRVPEDISVTGYNNDYISEIYNPAITSVEIPVETMVEQGYRMLCELSEGTGTPGIHMDIPNRLIVRESTGPAKT